MTHQKSSLRHAASLLIACAAGSASSQALPPAMSLPAWAQTKWTAVAEAKRLEISVRVNPFVWRGDYDGDAKQDLALLVRHSVTGKEGVVLLFRGTQQSLVVGAGSALGNAGDDFSWMDSWNVRDAGEPGQSGDRQSTGSAADGLRLAREGSGSGFIFLQAGKAVWRQQGD